MKYYIDYIYYRIRKWNYKYDNGEGLFAAGAIGLIEGGGVLDVYLVTTRLLFSPDRLNKYTTIADWPIGIVVSVIMVYNCYAYRDKSIFSELDSRWKNEPHFERRFKGCLVFITLLSPWVLLYFINAFFNHN